MALTERLALLISLDADGAVRGLEKVGRAADRNLGRAESKIDKTAQRMQKGGAVMLGAAGLAATGLYKAGQAASDLEQAVGGTEAVFGEAGGAIDRFAKGAADNMGLSEREFREATTSIGGQLKRMTGDVDFAAEKSVELTGVAADLAATYGGTTAEAVQALGAAFRGEADPAERFNLNLKVSAVQAKAVELGLAASTKEVDENARAQATLALIMEQSADAQGQFAREADTAAGQMQTASAATENAMAALGQASAPIIADVAGGLASVAEKFSEANEASDGLLSNIAAYGTIGVGALGAVSWAAGKVLENLKRIETALASTRLASSLGGAGGAAAGLGAVAAVLGAAAIVYDDYNNTKKAAEVRTESFTDALQNEGAAAKDAADALSTQELREYEDAFINAGVNLKDFTANIRENGDAIETMDDNISAWRDGNVDLSFVLEQAGIAGTELGDTFERLADTMGVADFYDFIQDVDGLSDSFDRANVVGGPLGGTLRGVIGAVRGALDPVNGLTGGMADQEEQIEDTVSAFEAYADKLRGTFDPLFGAIDASLDLEEAQRDVTEAQWAYNDALAEFGPDSMEAAAAERDLESAKRDVVRAALDQEVALNDLRSEVENGNVSFSEATTKLDMWVSQGKITKDQAALVKDELALVGLTAAAIPDRIDIDINVNRVGFEQALRDLTNEATGGRTRISVGGGGGFTAAEGGLVPNTKYMAMGGPVGTDTVPAWLTPGEFVMQRSAVDRLGVATLARLNAGGSTGATVTNHFMVTKEHDERSIASLVAWSLA